MLLYQMSGNKCRNCGSTNIETDPGRGDAICIECGFVLEDSVIISQTTFEESSSGKVRVPGHFVANDSTGSATNFGACKLFKFSLKEKYSQIVKSIIHKISFAYSLLC